MTILVTEINTSGIASGETISDFYAWRIGTTTYNTAIGGTNTVRTYTLDPNKAAIYYRINQTN
ncbi:hypothetical protein SDC9_211498 [bioreactor metagenome]|uniref:Uncharacterized protein n=1 Tax=bioreactor metagenome TaxID=1076179 RepID=A0A645JKG6_9ZZZZ